MAARLLVILLLALAVAAPPARAQDDTANIIVMQADEVRYDDINGITTATGSVEFAHQGRILQADNVTYNEPADLVIATGNVVLVEPTGEVLFSEYAEMTGDLREGLIRGIQILLAENARLAANGARRIDGRITEMSKAVYSPCELCEDSLNHSPFWQIKARRVIHDEALQDLIYYDATLELFGVPVVYTPYLRHPDPTVERRTGFLTPQYGSSSTLGYNLLVPYYFDLAPNRDFTFAPLVTEDEGVVLFGEYRERTETGTYVLDGSITYTDARDNTGQKTGGDEERWHLKAEGLWHYDQTWQYGFDLYRSSDDTYLSRYSINDADTLTSDLFAEGFRGRSYASAFGYAFQGLRPDEVQGEIPLVAPLLDYNMVTDPDEDGSFFTIDANTLALTRNDGTDSRRLSFEAGWERPFLTDGGHLFIYRASLRGDAYQVDDVQLGNGLPDYSGFVGRVIPQTSLEWRYPLQRQSGSMQQLVEPIVMTVLSPNGGNPAEIPNEDSQDFEFDDVNLFSENRFPGLDRVEGGLRINYGLRMGVYGYGGGRSEFLIGQVWHAQDDDTFGPQSGLDGHFSDFVGRVLISPGRYVDLLYRFRLSNDDLSFRRSELGFSVGLDWMKLSGNYIRLEDAPINVVDTSDAREQFNLRASTEILEEWTLQADWRQDLSGGGTISYGGSLTYENECIAITGRGERNFTDNIGIDPETVIFLTLKLKTLG
ncbi:MAG: LPS-assembly protein LptD [Rhodospirillaceae bacterium]|nr:LPS-assembly protein LptD [Rhodospirillaceae bacterium]